MPKNVEIILNGCFHPKQGKPNLRKVAVNKQIVALHLKKANSNLRAMQLMFNKDIFDWAIICGYYAMYHAVLAALYGIGIRAFAHYCAIAAFRKFYVERGKVGKEYLGYLEKAKELEAEYAENLEKAQETRVKEQYGVELITNDEAEWIIEDSKDFVLKIEEVLAG